MPRGKRTGRRRETPAEAPDLRDLFAAFALAGMLANPAEEQEDEEVVASAYALADQMLEQREEDPDDED